MYEFPLTVAPVVIVQVLVPDVRVRPVKDVLVVPV